MLANEPRPASISASAGPYALATSQRGGLMGIIPVIPTFFVLFVIVSVRVR